MGQNQYQLYENCQQPVLLGRSAEILKSAELKWPGRSVARARELPGKKTVGAELAFYLGDGYRDEGDDT